MAHTTRRNLVLSGAAAFAAFGLTRPIEFIGTAQAQTLLPGPGFKKVMVGDIEVYSLYDGVWEKPHDENFIKGANVEQTKARLRAAGLPDAFVPIPFTILAVKSGDRLLLIDTGTSGGSGPKSGLLTQSMAAAGLDPKSVRTIAISHFHGDHISGLMTKENAQAFPDAEIIVPAAELKWWTQPVDSIPQPRRGLAQRVQATLATWKNIKPVEGEVEIMPGVRTLPAHGHTQGHTAHVISAGGRQLISTADVTNIQSLFVANPEWQAAFDHVPDLAVETRKRIFDRAIADKAMVSGYHWGLPNIGTIQRDGHGYAFVPAA